MVLKTAAFQEQELGICKGSLLFFKIDVIRESRAIK
jgi:hypothetical protein